MTLVIRDCIRNTQASGFTGISAFWRNLAQATIILYPVAQALGVKKGVQAWCDRCRMLKYVWAPHCPHCGSSNPGTIADKALDREARGEMAVPYRRIALRQRLVIPLFLLVVFILYSGGNTHYTGHVARMIPLSNGENAEADRALADRIRKAIEQNPHPTAWVASVAEAPDDSSVHIPKRFRVDISYNQWENRLFICGYGLPWDQTEELVLFYAQALAYIRENANLFGQDPIGRCDTTGSWLGARRHLDNRVHWITGKKISPWDHRPWRSLSDRRN